MNKLLQVRQRPNDQHGALILLPTKELALQVYRTARLLDEEGRLNMSRMGSIAYYSNVIELLNNSRVENQNSANQIADIALDNAIASLKWESTDLLVVTPTLANNVMRFGRSKINPRYVVLDEADELLETNESIALSTKRVLKNLASRSSIDREQNSQRHFFLSCSNFPLTIDKRNSEEGTR